MPSLGLWMLLAAVALALLTGVPLYAALLGAATAFALGGAAAGLFDLQLFSAVPARLVGLLEQDLLQALPLYAWIGALLNRTRLAATLLKLGQRLFGGGAAGTERAGLALGGLLAPMNGAVGANVAMLSQLLRPALRRAAVSDGRATALVCVASTLGVAVPPSLVLFLLGDAMMRAHTEALIRAPIAGLRIINTQDLMQAALLPGALVLVAALGVVWLTRPRTAVEAPAAEPLTTGDTIAAAVALLVLGGLLVGVASGRLYAVEAAATGGLLLTLYAALSGQLTRPALRAALDDAARTTGLVFALLVAATCGTLVLRAFGTDALVGRWIDGLSTTSPGLALAAVLAAMALCALVLDAFELIFLVVPIVMPPLLAVQPDAAWVACLTLLVLQAGFLLPPFGYAVLTARAQANPPTWRALGSALLPFVAAQCVVIALVAGLPQLTQWLRSNPRMLASQPLLDNAEVERLMQDGSEIPANPALDASAP